MRIEQVSYEKMYNEMHEQMEAHYKEVPFGTYGLSLNLDHEAYMVAEDEGFARFYLVYIEDKAVAYLSMLAAPMTQHKGQLQAATDSFYVAPDYRNGGVFGKLLEFVEQDLKACGIRFLSVGISPLHDDRTKSFLDRVGYCTTEIHYTKEL